MSDVLSQLSQVLAERKTSANPEESYVALLHQKGLNKILEKVGEECTETLLAAKDYQNDGCEANRQGIIGETADLWFHSLVMLSHLGLGQCDIMQELEKRFGVSGLEEKASRTR